jgi:hypothetical protein
MGIWGCVMKSVRCRREVLPKLSLRLPRENGMGRTERSDSSVSCLPVMGASVCAHRLRRRSGKGEPLGGRQSSEQTRSGRACRAFVPKVGQNQEKHLSRAGTELGPNLLCLIDRSSFFARPGESVELSVELACDRSSGTITDGLLVDARYAHQF